MSPANYSTTLCNICIESVNDGSNEGYVIMAMMWLGSSTLTFHEIRNSFGLFTPRTQKKVCFYEGQNDVNLRIC